MNNQIARALPRAANPLVPPIGEKSRIQGLEAQVDDLKYTLHNLLQSFVALVGGGADGMVDGRPQEDRHAALVEDARAALRTEVADYLG